MSNLRLCLVINNGKFIFPPVKRTRLKFSVFNQLEYYKQDTFIYQYETDKTRCAKALEYGM